jgi:hypothetical protein
MALSSLAKRGSVSTRVDRLLNPTKENPVEMNIVNEVALLQRLSIAQLRQRFAELFGEATLASNRTWLVKRNAWRMQASDGGEGRRRAREAFRDAFLIPYSDQRSARTSLRPDDKATHRVVAKPRRHRNRQHQIVVRSLSPGTQFLL